MIFSLDIGTRTVVGIVAEEAENGVKVLDFEVAEHEERAMLDGQINDVPKVVKAVRRVHDLLEEKMKAKFEKVSTAVAGRFLKTVIGEASERIPSSKIDEEYVKSLEFSALSNAVEKNGQSRDYCVGYSILQYSVDGERVRNLVGQYGEKASVGIIAAFLPQRVVEALFSVMDGSDLSLDYLTLEPMAAMNLVIPQDLRRLNIALVDVGAGTSDIAISKDGSIVAYGMIPMAGDELTEKICDEHLLDFHDGELLKRILSDGTDLPKVNNVLGMPVDLSKEDLAGILEPVVETITDEISAMILDLNGKAPAAAVIVGGGARVPNFTEKIAEKLSLPQNRVALRGVENISYIEDMTEKMIGSEFVTPAGIAHSARFNIGKIFKRVTLNSRTVQLMNLTGREDILQVLMQGGFNVRKIVGDTSPGITYDLNGEIMVSEGSLPDPSVTVNGKKASLRTLVRDGDIVEIVPSEPKTKKLKLRDVVEPISVFVDGTAFEIFPQTVVNGVELPSDSVISDGDVIRTSGKVSVEDLGRYIKKDCKVSVNGIFYPLANFDVTDSEGKSVKVLEPDQNLKLKVSEVTVKDLFIDNDIGTITLTVNSKRMKLIVPSELKIGENSVTPDLPLNCGDSIEAVFGEMKIEDLFSVLNLNPNGFKVYINGEESEVDRVLRDGDSLEVRL